MYVAVAPLASVIDQPIHPRLAGKGREGELEFRVQTDAADLSPLEQNGDLNGLAHASHSNHVRGQPGRDSSADSLQAEGRIFQRAGTARLGCPRVPQARSR